jgi:glycerol-3-phosphate dehydrogenase (NAD(P)+)
MPPEPPLAHVAVLGSGGMGTALAMLFARAGVRASLWCRDPALAEQIQRLRENPRHLAGVAIPDLVRATSSIEEAVADANLLAVAIPSAFLATTIDALAPFLPPAVPILSVVKGISGARFRRPSEILDEALGPRSLAVLSGPSHAEEIVRGQPTSVVIGGPDASLNRRIQDVLNRDRFRVYTNPDVLGVELAGALKNVLGIAAGICDGLGFGDNAKAALLTRGLVEMARFGAALGAQPGTFLGLAGVGDLITTCFSPYGRNRAVGLRIGRGEALDRILATMADVAEGVGTARRIADLARERGIEMPITSEVDAILHRGKSPLDALSDLMLRMPREE